MLSYKRSDRVREVMLKEVGEIILTELKDPRLGFVTVTDVEVTYNLRSAKIFVSPMGTEEEKKKTFQAICHATPFIRRQLGRRMRIKYLPEISFKWDHTQEQSDKINTLLKTVEKEQADDA